MVTPIEPRQGGPQDRPPLQIEGPGSDADADVPVADLLVTVPDALLSPLEKDLALKVRDGDDAVTRVRRGCRRS